MVALSVQGRLDPRGFLWLGARVPYRIYRLRLTGDTVAIVERGYVPIDESRIPAQKPACETFYDDDGGRLWVNPVTEAGDSASQRAFDVFDAEGRLLGRLRFPWQVRAWPPPVIRGIACTPLQQIRTASPTSCVPH